MRPVRSSAWTGRHLTSGRATHKFVTGPDGYEAVRVHADPQLVTEWLE